MLSREQLTGVQMLGFRKLEVEDKIDFYRCLKCSRAWSSGGQDKNQFCHLKKGLLPRIGRAL